MPAEIKERYDFAPIGLLHTGLRWRYEAPRQAGFSDAKARIELYPGRGFEQALEDLAGFERVWVLFVFHLNATWKPKVTPPYAPENRKYGVFSTRSPHRPNPIGLSCVELEGIDGLNVYLNHCDILDRTPVLDIKPYIPAVDAFPESKAGWRDELVLTEWMHDFSPVARAQMDWIKVQTGLDLANFCAVQLKYEPFNSARKRIECLINGAWAIHCRTWRIVYRADADAHVLYIDYVKSNYAPKEFLPGAPDPYADKAFHRAFLEVAEWK